MNFKPGDKVKFLNDVGGGVITSIKGNIAEIENEDGFSIPVMITELVLDQDVSFEQKPVSQIGNLEDVDEESINIYEEIEDEFDIHKFKQNYQKNRSREQVEYSKEPKNTLDPVDIYLIVVPQSTRKIALDSFDIYLINDSNFKVLYNFALLEGDQYQYIDAGMVNANSKVRLKNFLFTDLNKMGQFVLQFIPFKAGKYQVENPASYTLEINHKKWLSENFYKENNFFSQNAYVEKVELDTFKKELNKLDEKEIKKALKDKKEKLEPVKKPKNSNSDNLIEVDLHIENLADDHKELESGEILDIQLARFETALETAIRGNSKRIVFIHGVGNGKLKFELRKMLDDKYKKLQYQDASFREYGFGATMVMLRK